MLAIMTSLPLLFGPMQKLRLDELWIPKSSEYYKNSEWIKDQGIDDEVNPGTHIMISTEHENGSLLTFNSFDFATKIHAFVLNFTSKSGINFKKTCLHDPAIMRSSELKEVKSLLSELPPYPKTCGMIKYFLNQLTTNCANLTPLLALTSSSEIHDVHEALDEFQRNDTLIVEYFRDLEKQFNGTELPEFRFVGGLDRDYRGRIKSARAMHFAYLFEEDEDFCNETTTLVGKYTIYQEEIKDALISKFSSHVNKENLELFINFGMKQEVFNLLQDDIIFLAIGCVIVVLHLMVCFSKFNTVEQRIGLAVCGLISCGLSVVSMHGICQLLGVPFNVLDNLVMVILVGIGVDDMFVILQTIKSKTSQESER